MGCISQKRVAAAFLGSKEKFANHALLSEIHNISKVNFWTADNKSIPNHCSLAESYNT
jgi:hypothetical protein